MGQVFKIFRMARYRFFFFAGILPYFLGQTLAFNQQRFLNPTYFFLGFLAMLFVLTGVELFNEYFDAKSGGDRIFSNQSYKIPVSYYILAILLFLSSFLILVYFLLQTGWLIFLFALAGFTGAYFYVGPPLKWAYRGLGELVIALSYGPFMITGSYFIQMHRIDFIPLLPSLIVGAAIFSLAMVNEIPDYYQDRLVGKRNLIVKLGREKAIDLLSITVICIFLLIGSGVIFNKIPVVLLATFLPMPLILKSLVIIRKNYEKPDKLRLPINSVLSLYLLIVVSFFIGYIIW